MQFRFETKPGLFSKDEVDAGTKLLVEQMVIKPTDLVLDLGCGYGVIGLVAASLANKGKVYMVDTDIRAVKCSLLNARLNHINNAEIKISDAFEEITNVKFDIVLSNPPSHLPKAILVEFIEGAKKQLKKRGLLYFVSEKRIKPLIKREFERIFKNYDAVIENSRYVVSVAVQS